jgi:hydroxylaminobenzene mutase
VTFYSSIASMYLIWVSITMSAVLGASQALPMAGQGFSSSPLSEMVIEAIIYTGAGLGIVSSMLIVLGLYKGLNKSEA